MTMTTTTITDDEIQQLAEHHILETDSHLQAIARRALGSSDRVPVEIDGATMPMSIEQARESMATLRDDVERRRLADDLARWAGKEAELIQLETCAADGCRCDNCGPRARADGDRNEYAFAMELPLDKLRKRHASDLAERGGVR